MSRNVHALIERRDKEQETTEEERRQMFRLRNPGAPEPERKPKEVLTQDERRSDFLIGSGSSAKEANDLSLISIEAYKSFDPIAIVKTGIGFTGSVAKARSAGFHSLIYTP